METKFDKYLIFQLTDWDLFQTVIRLATWRRHDRARLNERANPSLYWCHDGTKKSC